MREKLEEKLIEINDKYEIMQNRLKELDDERSRVSAEILRLVGAYREIDALLKENAEKTDEAI